MGVDAVLEAVEVEGGLGALVQDGASGHEGDLGGSPTHVQGTHQRPLWRLDPLSREGVLARDGIQARGHRADPAPLTRSPPGPPVAP